MQLQMALRCIRLDPSDVDVVDTLHLADISRSGMGAYTDRAFYPGQRVVVCMPLSGENGRRNLYARVVRCRPDDEGYRVGLEFESATFPAWQSQDLTALAAA